MEQDENNPVIKQLRRDFCLSWHQMSIEYWVLARTGLTTYGFTFTAPHLYSIAIETMLKQIIVQFDSAIPTIIDHANEQFDYLRTDKIFKAEKHNIFLLIERLNSLNAGLKILNTANIESKSRYSDNTVWMTDLEWNELKASGQRQFNSRYFELPKTISVPDCLDILFYYLRDTSKNLLNLERDKLDFYLEKNSTDPLKFDFKSVVFNNRGFFHLKKKSENSLD